MDPINVVDLRVSKVAPQVEDNLTQLVDMVKQMGRKGDLTESQNRRMVGYLGNLDDMRQQIVVMVQRYENDSKVLKRLLNLIDRIDDVKQLTSNSQASQGVEENTNNTPTVSDAELAKQYDTPFNPLMVSAIGMLDVSGLFNDEIRPEDVKAAVEEEEEEEEGDEYWDHEDDPAALAEAAEELPNDIMNINISASNILPNPNYFDLTQPSTSTSNTTTSTTNEAPSTLSSSLKQDLPAPSASGSREKAKGKGKGKGKGKVTMEYFSSDESSASGTESEEEDTYTGSSTSDDESHLERKVRPNGASAGESSSARRPKKGKGLSRSDITRGAHGVPAPPPPPPFPRKKAPKAAKKGPCPPVLCKICYDEYDRLEQLFTFPECKHEYCRECLQDYLTTNINEGAVLDLVCPFPECEAEVHPQDVKELCPPPIFSKYEKFTVIAALRMDPNARWCPNPECNNGIKADPKQQWVYCNACKFEFCFHCMAERHDGAACGKEALEFLEKKKESEELAFEKFKEFTVQNNARVKPCPTCHAYIEKNDGCNHMTCGNQACKAQFCWLCLNIYAPDHFSNDIDFPDCYDKQYYTPPDAYPNVYVPPYVPPPRRRLSNIAKKVGIYMGVGVAVVTLGVPAAVIGGPVYGCFQLHKRLKSLRRRNAYRGNPDFVPPSQERIAEAAREAARLRALEREIYG